jgi:hypothetical protein
MQQAFAQRIDAAWGLRTVVALAFDPLVATNAPRRWVHVAYEGQWSGHHSGPFELSAEIFAQCIANQRSQANPSPLYFGHEDMEPGPEPEAKGWIHDLRIGPDKRGRTSLWAYVEFGADAAAGVVRGGWRFCSAVFDFAARDRVSGAPVGCVIRSLALTGSPFIDGQEPIRLSQRAASSRALGGSMDQKVSKEALLAALEFLEKDEFTIAELEAAMMAAAAKDGTLDAPEAKADEAATTDAPPSEEMPKPPAPLSAEPSAPAALEATPPPPAPPAAPPVAAAEEPAAGASDAGAMAIAALMGALGLDEAGVLAWIEEHKEQLATLGPPSAGDAAALAAPTAALSTRVTALTTQLAAAQATVKSLSDRLGKYEQSEETARQAKAKADVDALISAGRLEEAARDPMTKLALSDRAAFDALAPALRPVVPVGEHAAATNVVRGEDDTNQPEVTDEEIAEYRRVHLSNLPGRKKLTDEQLNEIARDGLRQLKNRTSRRAAAVQ